jgi:hypothetical protein
VICLTTRTFASVLHINDVAPKPRRHYAANARWRSRLRLREGLCDVRRVSFLDKWLVFITSLTFVMIEALVGRENVPLGHFCQAVRTAQG